jgi:hypothetical protein
MTSLMRPIGAPLFATPSSVTVTWSPALNVFAVNPKLTSRGPQGQRLGPNPIPFARFQAYVRNPTGDMQPFTAKVISDQDLQSIYAFVQSRPTPPPVKDIPLLAP